MNPNVTIVNGLPVAFRLFKYGWNRTSKGNFRYDELSAKSVMAEYKRHGVDMMIDLEHLSVDDEANNYDPDARGWGQLEERPDKSLWMVNVRWTPDGEKRMRNRTQRFVSPYFGISVRSGRIIDIYNIAICAVPATYEAPALVAASARTNKQFRATALEVIMDPELKKIADALGLADGAALDDVLAAIAALQASVADDGGDETATDDGDEAGGDAADEETSDDEPGEVAASDEISPDDLKGLKPKMQAKILALSGSAVANSKRLAALEKKAEANEVTAMIAANADKFTPQTEKWAKRMSAAVVKEFLRFQPKVSASKKTQPTRTGDNADSVNVSADGLPEKAELTDADKRLLKITKGDPKKILAKRQKELDAKREKAMLGV